MSKAQLIYDEICRLSLHEKAALYEMIASDFERAGIIVEPDTDTPSSSVPQVHVPRWLYRILARWH